MPEQIENRMVVDSDYHIRKTVCLCDQCSGPIYEDDDFYDFDGFVLQEEDFRNLRRTGYYGTGTIVYERWIQTDIPTAIRIFELQQGMLY